MKYFVSIAVLSTLVCGANAAQTARPTMSGKMIMTGTRYTASVNQLNGVGVNPANIDSVPASTVVDRREAERNACINKDPRQNDKNVKFEFKNFLLLTQYNKVLNETTINISSHGIIGQEKLPWELLMPISLIVK